jgi:hypothetical protein
MSIAMVDAALSEFLRSEEPRVVALTGKWGRGKTFFWRRFLERQVAQRPQGPRYSYVSLFGLTDLSALKDALFESVVPFTEIGSKDGGEVKLSESNSKAADSAWQRLSGLVSRTLTGGRKLSGLAETFPGVKDFGPFLKAAAFLSIRNQLICVDDLERRSSSLALKDVLGLLSFLREQRGCRVLVILNSDALSKADRDEFDAFREKVFDYEVSFEPTAAECAAIALPASMAHYAQAKTLAVKLGIQNIRVLTRIKRTIDLMHPHVATLHESVLTQVIHSSVLLCWSYNTHGEDAPPYRYVRNLNLGSFMDMPPTYTISDEEKVWNTLLKDYGYTNTDDLDLVLCDYLEKGFLDIERVQSVLAERHNAAVRDRLLGAFEVSWDMFHESFADNESDIVSAFQVSMKAAAQWISLNNAAAAVSLVRDIGRNDVADEMTQHWIQVQKEHNPAVLDLDQNHLRFEIRDLAFVEAVRSEARGTVTDPSLREVVAELGRRNGWSQVDERVLRGASEDEYYNLFKTLVGPDERRGLRACLQFASMGGSSSVYREIGEKAIAALRRIGRESSLNRLRVSSLGIKHVDETDIKGGGASDVGVVDKSSEGAGQA